MTKRKILIIIIITIVSILGIGVFHVVKYYGNDIAFNFSMLGVNKDIIIKERGGRVVPGGYANSSREYYVDIGKKKIYRVGVQDVWGVTFSPNEAGEHRYLEYTKSLTDNQLESILNMTKMSSNYSESSSSSALSMLSGDPEYYVVTYNNTSKKILKSSVPEVVNILISIID